MAKINKVTRSFNSGELSPLMDSRSDQAKYDAGAKTMENFIPLIYGAAERRPGLEFIAAQKSSSAKGRLVGFEHSVDDTYALLFENQVIRFFKNGAQVVDGVGTEDITTASPEYTIDAVDTGTETFTISDDGDLSSSFADGTKFRVNGSTGNDATWTVSSTAFSSPDFVITVTGNITDATVDGTVGHTIAHWLLNEDEGVVAVDDDGATHNGTISVDASIIAADGKVGSGSFDLDGQYTVTISDSNDFSFTNNSNDFAFSLACWAFVTQQSGVRVLLSKWRNNTVKREWRFDLSSDQKLRLRLADTSFDLSGDAVSQWKLNESAGDLVVVDTIGLQNGESSVITSTLAATGKISGAFDFDGQYEVEVANNAAYSFGNGVDDSPFSIAAWIFVTTGEVSQTILSKYSLNSKREWKIYYTGTGKIRFRISDESANSYRLQETDGTLSNGWHFICGTYNGVGGNSAEDGLIIYIDGEVVPISSITVGTYTAMENKSTPIMIGASLDGSDSPELFFQDKIDSIVLFGKKLDLAEVQSLYNDGSGTEVLAGAEVITQTNSSISEGWHFFCSTYSAPALESTAANGILLYVDGVLVDSTPTNNTNYTAMQNESEGVRIGSQRNTGDSANEKFWGDKIDEVSIFSDVLTPTEIASLYSTIPFEITSPYLTADLPTLKLEQSADVMFITHPAYESRRLSRFGDTVWTLVESDLRTGPFRDQNTDTSLTITASATTGNVTLTAAGTGNKPFALGSTAGHEPSGSKATSKSLTGALFKLVQAVSGTDQSIGETLDSTTTNAVTSTLTVPKGVTWDWTTNGTWGTGGPSTIVLERSYDSGTTYETVHSVSSLANHNVATSETEEVDDALYRSRVLDGTGTGDASIQFSIRDTSHIGIVEITSVTSSTVALGTILTTLASTDPTHRWSEGSFSNRRGWPIDVTISAEERLTFAGNISEPLTIWGSAIGGFTDFALGVNNNDAIQFTLVGTGQQNRIRWMLAKEALVLGTVGGEHLLGASKDEEALTPTNVKAKIQTTYGSENIAAKLVNQAVLFVQRGGKKIREFLYNFEADSHKADDLTVFANHITGAGIVDMAFQRTPDPMLWCIRTDGQIAALMYERDQNVFSWHRLVTNTNLAGTSTASVFESVAVIFGGVRSEDEVWVSVLRQISGSDARYIERFRPRSLPSSQSDYRFLDSSITDTGGDTTIEGLTHLKGQTVQVFGDGLVQATKVVIPTATSHWLMNETTGTTITDAEGSDDGTSANNSSTMTVAGKIGTALEFNGTDDVITITDSTSFDFTTELSVFAWIKTGTLVSGGGIVTKSVTAGSFREWAFILGDISGSSSKLTVQIGASGGASATGEITTDTVISNGVWTHVGFVYNSGSVSIYINGSLVGSNNISHANPLNNEAVDIKIGKHETNEFNGVIDDVRIYGSVLTTSVISALYNSGNGTELLGGQITAATTADKYQVGIGYDSTLVPMDLEIEGTNLTTTKRINRTFVNLYKTIGGTVGPDSSNQEDIPTGTSLFTGFKRVSIPGGYTRDTDITILQTDPLPMTVLSIGYDVGASND